MALTETQRAHIREVLGWQSLFHQHGPGNRVESAMTAIGENPEDEATVVSLLGKLTTLDGLIEGAYSRLRAQVVGSITLNAGEIGQLKSEGRRLCKTLAAILGVTIPRCKYGGSTVGGGEILYG